MEAIVTYDYEACFVELRTDEGQTLDRTCEFRRDHPSWEAAKEAALARAQTRVLPNDPPPQGETIQL